MASGLWPCSLSTCMLERSNPHSCLVTTDWSMKEEGRNWIPFQEDPLQVNAVVVVQSVIYLFIIFMCLINNIHCKRS